MIMLLSGKSSVCTSNLDRTYSADVHRLNTHGDDSSGIVGGNGVHVMPTIEGFGIHMLCSCENTTPSISVSDATPSVLWLSGSH